MVESVSLWTGIRSLLVLAAAPYLASWLALAYRKGAQQGPGELASKLPGKGTEPEPLFSFKERQQVLFGFTSTADSWGE